MLAKVYVTLKQGVLDPQGQAVQSALKRLGHGNVGDVRQGKYFEINLTTSSVDSAREDIKAACEQLLANTVIEDYRVEVESA